MKSFTTRAFICYPKKKYRVDGEITMTCERFDDMRATLWLVGDAVRARHHVSPKTTLQFITRKMK
jgi:hypothetical protein